MVPYEGSLQIRTNQFIQFSNGPHFEILRYVSNCSLYFLANQAGHTNRFVLLNKQSWKLDWFTINCVSTIKSAFLMTLNINARRSQFRLTSGKASCKSLQK